VSAAGVPVKLDVCVPLGALPSLVARLDATVAAVAAEGPRDRVRATSTRATCTSTCSTPARQARLV
jgi:hypothetical protein